MTYSNTYRYVTTQLVNSGSPNPIIAELPFTGVQFSQKLNAIGTFQGDLLLGGIDVAGLNVITGTTPGKTILHVINTQAGVVNPNNQAVVWSGVIWTREYNSSTQLLTIRAQEIGSYFERRMIIATAPATSITYTNTDPTTIAAGLLTQAQGVSNGNIGVTGNVIAGSSVTLSRTYHNYEMKSVHQAILDLSRATGAFDFQFRGQLNVGGTITLFCDLKGPTLGNAFDFTSSVYGKSPVWDFPGNIVEYTYPEDGTTAANTVYGLGTGTNEAKLIVKATDSSRFTVYPNATITNASISGGFITFTASNTFVAGQFVNITGVTPLNFNISGTITSATSTTFKIATTITGSYTSGGVASLAGDYGNWPIIEISMNNIDISDLRLLENLTIGRVNAVSAPPVTMQIVVPSWVDPQFGSYGVGDQAKIIINDDRFPNYGINTIYRIVAIDVAPGDSGPDKVTLTLTLPIVASVLGS